MSETKSLVIVESPAKAKTIAKYLGDGFIVESSIGHIRDLPKRAADIPAKYKKESWARLGVNVNEGFEPLYIVDPAKKEQIAKLKKLLKDTNELYLATDEDREGESIAWHLLEVLKPKVPVKRMVFHEITPQAIREAVQQPRDINQNLVDAQEARRILDRLYGYEVSPVLWKKVMPRLSAGRVQSVATRVIVERERARMRFVRVGYWDIEGRFSDTDKSQGFDAQLYSLGGERVASGKDFDENGKLKKDDVRALDEKSARALQEKLESAVFQVSSVEKKPLRRSPQAPFMTSTLQQEAGSKLKFSTARTMRAAQRLYEQGFITYMRTDSTTLSETAVKAARKAIAKNFGEKNVPDKARVYKKKSKNAQEAHEAIRPSGDIFAHPADVAKEVGLDESKVYNLIWKRTLASQMKDAAGERVSARIRAEVDEGGKPSEVLFSASGQTITFPGFLSVYASDPSKGKADDKDNANKDKLLPPLTEGQKLLVDALSSEGHETQPPARFTEASLVRRLEELGVGRPSTYASTVSTILDRGYIWKKGTALVPSFKAFAVVTLLEQHFGHLVDYAFTARMEDELDSIAAGEEQTGPWLRKFYFGTDEPANTNGQTNGASVDPNGVHHELGLAELVSEQLGEIDARQINTLPIGHDENGEVVAVRVGRYGPYIQRGEDTVSLPDNMPPDELTIERALEFLAQPSGDVELGNDPETGEPVFLRNGRYGVYVQLGEAGEGNEKPKTASILQGQTPEDIDFEWALKLLSLPRVVGKDEEGVEILANNGRYGAYIMRGKDNRSLESDDQIFTITTEEALKVLAQPKKRGRRQAQSIIRELGDDPVSGGKITLRKGRFGPYVTDGETNASLRAQDDPESLTEERAHELLQLRREQGPAKKKKKASKKKATKKKKTTKKAAKKKTTKKKASKRKATKKKASKKKTTAKKK